MIASDPAALQTQAGRDMQVFGPFAGKLANSGETIRLINNSGRVLNRVEYGCDGDWPAAPDGSGVSLARIDPVRGVEDAANWTWSDQVGGTPGAVNFPQTVPADRPLRFNEIDAPGGGTFRIEIVNRGMAAASLVDCRLEIQGGSPVLLPLPQTTLGPGEFLVVSDADLGVDSRRRGPAHSVAGCGVGFGCNGGGRSGPRKVSGWRGCVVCAAIHDLRRAEPRRSVPGHRHQ